MDRRDKENNYFNIQRERSLAQLQELSGNRWTDFNEHDPGVTILDLLCYALFELHYRAEFDFDHYLGAGGSLSYDQVGLLPAREIFERSVVTVGDYRMLFMRTVEELVDCTVELLPDNRYRVAAKVRRGADLQAVKRHIRELYHQNRNLCQTLQSVEVVETSTPGKTARDDYESPLAYNQSSTGITGHHRSPSSYRSIAGELPNCYGVNEYGLPAGANDLRRAQVRQLSGYLLLFDYMLCSMASQMDSISTLLGLSDRIPERCEPQIEIRDFENLVDTEQLKLNAIVDPQQMQIRKGNYFDILDALYGESSRFVEKFHNNLSQINRHRAEIIRKLPELNARRFRSFNLLDSNFESIATIKEMMHVIWNNSARREVPLTNLFGRYGLRLVNDSTVCRSLHIFFDTRYLVDEFDKTTDRAAFAVVPTVAIEQPEKEYDLLNERLNIFAHNIVFESFLTHGLDPDNYRIETLDDQTGYLLLYKHPLWGWWLNIGYFAKRDQLIYTANLLWHFLTLLNNDSTTFYLFENILLYDEQCDDCNRLTIIFPSWRHDFFRESNYPEQLADRLPIHLRTEVFWMDAEQMYVFEQHYYAWRYAWATDNADQIRSQGEAIRQLLHTIDKPWNR